MENRVTNNRFCDRAASALAEAVRLRMLEKSPVGIRREVVLVTGSPASGKTVATARVRKNSIEIVHETIFTDFQKAQRRVQEALDANRLPQIILIYTTNPRINVQRMLSRARQIGRTVPLAYMARTYIEVPKIVSRLHAHFHDVLSFTLMNNSGTPDEAVTHQDIQQFFQNMGSYTIDECLKVMTDELNQIHQKDPLPLAIYQEAMLGVAAS